MAPLLGSLTCDALSHTYMIPKATKLFSVLTFAALAVVLVRCVSPLELETETESRLTISGIVSNDPNQRVISVVTTNELSTKVTPVAATGRVLKDGEFLADLESPETGKLQLPANLVFEEGSTYSFEITSTSGGSTFQTFPQLISAPSAPQSLTWRKGTDLSENSDGLVIEVPVVEILTEIPIEPEQPAQYFRYQMETVYELREVPKESVDTTITVEERFVIGVGTVYDTVKLYTPDTVKTCYIPKRADEFPSVLVETNDLATGLARQPMLTREIDDSFKWKHFFNVYLHRIDERAYNYYRQLERLSSLNGSLYDEVPAAVRGNLFDVSDSTRIVLGYIELAVVDTLRLSLNEGDLGQIIQDGCRPGSGEEIECPPQLPHPTTGEPTPCKCWDCDIVYGKDKAKKPFYWDE